MTASAFEDAGSDGPAVGKGGGVIHEGQVALEVVGSFDELLAEGDFGLGFLGQPAEIVDDLLGLTGEEFQSMLSHPRLAIGMIFTQ